MKPLITYLYEAIQSKRFSNYTSNLEKLCGIEHLHICKDEKLKKFFGDIISSNSHLSKTPFIYSAGAKYFKMPYEFTPVIKAAAIGHDFEIREEGGEKISLLYKGKKIMETGRGSNDRVPTKLQEDSTCLLWNICMDVSDEENAGLEKLNDMEYVKNIIVDAYGEDAEKLTRSWIASFSKQITTLVEYCKSLNIDPKEYRMVRYGDKSKVAESYTAMVKSYTKFVGGEGRNMKDTYDPSDVILYKVSEVDSIRNVCKPGNDDESCMSIMAQYKEKLFIPHICMGISLKQILSRGKVDVFNVHSNSMVGDIREVSVSPSTKNGLTLLCNGTFNFDDTTDENGEHIKKTSSVQIVMRTFGGGRVGVEVKLNERGCPSLGKCPVDVWREELGCNQSDKIDVCVRELANHISDKEKIAKLIKYAIKEGPHCFPFLLLH